MRTLDSMGLGNWPRFFRENWHLIAMSLSPIPACGITAWLVKDIPVVRKGNSDYDYLAHHWNFAWIAFALFLLVTILSWLSSPTLRGIVRYELRLLRLWGTGCVWIRPSESEAKAWRIADYKYPAKKLAKKYQGIERRKRA